MILIIRILLGALFVFSGILKMTDLAAFNEAVRIFGILPQTLIVFPTLLVPAVEVVCGISLIFNLFRKFSSIVLLFLVLIFNIAISINLYQGKSFDCNCFGPLQIFSQLSYSHIIFNMFLILLLSISYLKDSREVSLMDDGKVIGVVTLILALLINVNLMNRNLFHGLAYRNIKAADFEMAMEYVETKNALLFDARSIEKYEDNHVPGALPLPLDEFERFHKNYGYVKKTRPVFVYCDHSNCSGARKIAVKLIERGMKNVFHIPEGWEGWIKLSQSLQQKSG